MPSHLALALVNRVTSKGFRLPSIGFGSPPRRPGGRCLFGTSSRLLRKRSLVLGYFLAFRAA
jgi:hypothetical protein